MFPFRNPKSYNDLPSAILMFTLSHSASPSSNILTFTHTISSKNPGTTLFAKQLAPHLPQK
jgi:hypothetical protein